MRAGRPLGPHRLALALDSGRLKSLLKTNLVGGASACADLQHDTAQPPVARIRIHPRVPHERHRDLVHMQRQVEYLDRMKRA